MSNFNMQKCPTADNDTRIESLCKFKKIGQNFTKSGISTKFENEVKNLQTTLVVCASAFIIIGLFLTLV